MVTRRCSLVALLLAVTATAIGYEATTVLSARRIYADTTGWVWFPAGSTGTPTSPFMLGYEDVATCNIILGSGSLKKYYDQKGWLNVSTLTSAIPGSMTGSWAVELTFHVANGTITASCTTGKVTITPSGSKAFRIAIQSLAVKGTDPATFWDTGLTSVHVTFFSLQGGTWVAAKPTGVCILDLEVIASIGSIITGKTNKNKDWLATWPRPEDCRAGVNMRIPNNSCYSGRGPAVAPRPCPSRPGSDPRRIYGTRGSWQ